MRYTVVWQPAALRYLTQIWLHASDQQAVADASDAIDRELGDDPETKGIPLGKFLVREEHPLSVLYHVSPDDRMVRVVSVRRL